MNSREQLLEIQKNLRVLIQSIQFIQASEDVEAINVTIDSMQVAADNLDILFEHGPKNNVRREIYLGVGDYGKIQQKCIKLGVVNEPT